MCVWIFIFWVSFELQASSMLTVRLIDCLSSGGARAAPAGLCSVSSRSPTRRFCSGRSSRTGRAEMEPLKNRMRCRLISLQLEPSSAWTRNDSFPVAPFSRRLLVHFSLSLHRQTSCVPATLKLWCRASRRQKVQVARCWQGSTSREVEASSRWRKGDRWSWERSRSRRGTSRSSTTAKSSWRAAASFTKETPTWSAGPTASTLLVGKRTEWRRTFLFYPIFDK